MGFSKYKEDVIKIKGTMTYFYTKNGMKYIMINKEQTREIINKAFDRPEFTDDFKESAANALLTVSVKGYFIEGKEFADKVMSGEFLNNKGSINKIYVDRYLTNLGVFFCTKDGKFATFGDFLISPDIFKQLSEEHEVMVDWVETTPDLSGLLDLK